MDINQLSVNTLKSGLNMRLLLLTLLFGITFLQAKELSEDAQAGKKLFKSCNACHDANLSPPLAPPMFAIQKKYSRVTTDKQAFVDKVTSFVAHPSKNASLFPQAIAKLGLMPTLGFPKQDVEKIASFIYENKFEYPCGHWKAGMKMAKTSDDMEHYKQDKRKLEKFCSVSKSTTAKLSAKPLKDVMKQLGIDFNNLNQAILSENYEKIASSANAIAFHPEVLPFQKKTLKAYFGKEMKLFKQTDTKVHNLSVEIANDAKSNNINAAIKNQGKLLEACMDCHQVFRERAQQALEEK